MGYKRKGRGNMDYSFIAEYAPLYLEAALLTIKIAASGINYEEYGKSLERKMP